MSRGTELRENRRMTRAFIQTSPVTVSLIPYEKQSDDTGNWNYIAHAPRQDQVVKLVEPTLQSEREPAPTIDGIVREPTFELVGLYDLEIALFDRFILDTVEYEVIHLWVDNGWEKRASVISRA